jgi:hypothetical protein
MVPQLISALDLLRLVVKGRGITHGGLPGVTYMPQLISSWEELAAIKPLDREYSDPA